MNSQTFKSTSLAVALLLAGVAGLAADDTDRWLHVRVQDGSDANVAVNLPLTAVTAAVEMVPADVRRMEIDGADVSVEDLRNIWSELREHPNQEIVKVDEPDQQVVISLVDEYLRVTVTGTENVQVRIPIEVVDALFSGQGNELAIGAALEALEELSGGTGMQELVTVEGDDENVRIWIDASASGDGA